MTLYIFAPVLQTATQPYHTATAETYFREEIWELKGIIIREEAVIPSQGFTAFPVVSDGQAVAAGTKIALCGKNSILSPAAGIYTHQTDGYEYLAAEQEFEFSLDDAKKLLAAQPINSPNLGKIITEHSWLLVAVADAAICDTVHKGNIVELTTVEDRTLSLHATVVHISQPEHNQCAMVFRCIDHLTDTVSLRHLTVSMPRSRVDGLRIPTNAVYSDETGNFVYVLSASHAEKIYVNILLEEHGKAIVSAGNSADTLQVGDTIIISKTELRDGMLLN